MLPTKEDLKVFRKPKELCSLVNPNRLGISAECFFNRAAGGLYQKLREAWVLSRLGIVISRSISPVLVSVVDGPLLDGIFRFGNSREWKVEVVMVLKPGRQLGKEYRKGHLPRQKLSDFSGQPANPSWLRQPILRKVRKVKERDVTRHLVAYLNYGGAVPHLGLVAKVIPEAKDAFESTWLLREGVFALLFAKAHVRHPVRKWKSFWKWLPNECKP